MNPIRKFMIYWLIIATVITSCSQQALQFSMQMDTLEIADAEQGMLCANTQINDPKYTPSTSTIKKRCNIKHQRKILVLVGVLAGIGIGYLTRSLWNGCHAIGNTTQGISTTLVPPAMFSGSVTIPPLLNQPTESRIPSIPKHKNSCKKYRRRRLNAGNRHRILKNHQNHTTMPSRAQCSANMQLLFRELVRTHPDMYKVKYLIKESGPYLNMRDDKEHKATALMLAAREGHKSIVDALIAKKAALDLQDKDGTTALMLAIRYGHLEIAKMLLDSRANPNLKDKDANTAFVYAARGADPFIVAALIHAGADIKELLQQA